MSAEPNRLCMLYTLLTCRVVGGWIVGVLITVERHADIVLRCTIQLAVFTSLQGKGLTPSGTVVWGFGT